jgi:hypothetical protein
VEEVQAQDGAMRERRGERRKQREEDSVEEDENEHCVICSGCGVN